jgi:hypothetical protein
MNDQATGTHTNDDRNGRAVFHWIGKNRDADQARLADAIAAAIPDLFVHNDGAIVQVDKASGLTPINFATFRDLVAKHVCALRLVPNGAGWQRNYFSYSFPPPGGPDWRHGGRRPSPNASEPDNAVLEWLYREGLAPLLPRVVE